jgi:hypothetical protein
MKIETKFDIETTVFEVDSDYNGSKIACDNCEGSGFLYSKSGIESRCGKCSGFGNIYDHKLVFKPRAFRIDFIWIKKDAIQYASNSGYADANDIDFLSEEHLFETEEEAQKECDKRNKMLKIAKDLR